MENNTKIIIQLNFEFSNTMHFFLIKTNLYNICNAAIITEN